jgi:hypothetical protein
MPTIGRRNRHDHCPRDSRDRTTPTIGQEEHDVSRELIIKDVAGREAAERRRLEDRLEELKAIGQFDWNVADPGNVIVEGRTTAPSDDRQREAVKIAHRLTDARALALVLDAAAKIALAQGGKPIGQADFDAARAGAERNAPVVVDFARTNPTSRELIDKAKAAATGPPASYLALVYTPAPNPKPHNPGVLLDPLFLAVRADDDDTRELVHGAGLLFTREGNPKEVTGLSADEQQVVGIVGILVRDNRTDTNNGRFQESLALARAEYRRDELLYQATLVVLADEGGSGVKSRTVQARDWASVVQELVGDGVAADDINLRLKVQIALGNRTGADDRAPASSIEIDLPDLEAAADVEIVESNLHAMQAIYFAATLEEVRLFEVVDKLVELFNSGMLPVGRGKGGNLLFRYWKKSIERFTEVERRNLYARSFGWPGGEASQNAQNREFGDLWLRFVSAVSSFTRQATLENLLTSSLPNAVSQEQVRKAGRDLAANLSLYGYGMAYFAATELQTQIREIIEVLSDPDVKGSYGARDMWQVIDQVAALELGGARNSVRYRTMAQSGAVIIRWLANNASRLSGVGRLKLLDETAIRLARVSGRPTVDPTDRDLVDACEQWLAVTGTSDARVEQYAQPVEGPNQTSRPIQLPGIARDLLQSTDLDGMGLSLN